METARKWLHNLGFDVLHTSKWVFIDGHKRPDVVESREKCLRKMTECGFLRHDNAPTEEAARADVPHMSKEGGEKRIVWFHDKSAYNTTEDTPVLWEENGKLPIKPKGKGSSIMLSEFIEEKDSYLALSDEQYGFEVTIVVMVFRSLPLPSWRSERTVKDTGMLTVSWSRLPRL